MTRSVIKWRKKVKVFTCKDHCTQMNYYNVFFRKTVTNSVVQTVLGILVFSKTLSTSGD